MREVRDANRRKDTQIQRIFTVAPIPISAAILKSVSTPEKIPLKGHAGEVYRSAGSPLDLTQAMGRRAILALINSAITSKPAARAPVRDASGKK